jgi:hypothetical protein
MLVGLYLNPPDKAPVLCVDEKSQIQALDRTQPGLPMKKGRAATMQVGVFSAAGPGTTIHGSSAPPSASRSLTINRGSNLGFRLARTLNP